MPCWKKSRFCSFLLMMSDNNHFTCSVLPCAICLLTPSSFNHSLFPSSLHGHLAEDCSTAPTNRTEIQALTAVAKQQLRIKKAPRDCKNTNDSRHEFCVPLSGLLGHLTVVQFIVTVVVGKGRSMKK